MSADGCFVDACLILSKEEYFAKVLFDKEGLLQLLLPLPSESEEPTADYSLPHELMIIVEEDSSVIAFNFGDLLTHIPIFERAKWKEYYRGMKAAVPSIHANHLDRLLFCDFQNVRESELASSCWNQRLNEWEKANEKE